ncbi:MAG: enoyl-CoA hydratase-related protein, partial [Pseudomonadota bacterium]|nr:enoyl-CoA hydratase-related protein [Pseudomonadota bacterium]
IVAQTREGQDMDEIDLSFDGPLAVITLNRPRRKNALTEANWRALHQAAQRVAQSPARALLVRGAGGDFCAGFDISEIEPDKADALTLIDDAVNPALRALRDVPQPTIAAAEGACVGGGFGIAAACDITIASDTAKFSAPYVNIGIMADAGLHVFLRDSLGYQRAAHLIFTGSMLGARDALAAGICAEVLSQDGFDAAAIAYASRIARGPTQAFLRSKTILRTAEDGDSALAMEARLQAEVFRTQDAREGIGAFLAGRKPRFTGS